MFTFSTPTSRPSRSSPKVSICLPTCNRPELIVECIDSCLAQTYGNLEIVIGDDSKDERTRQLIAQMMRAEQAIGVAAETGRDAVDGLFATHLFGQKVRRARYRRQLRRGKFDLGAVSHGHELRPRQRTAVELDLVQVVTSPRTLAIIGTTCIRRERLSLAERTRESVRQ